jgi:hypothetical protein
MNRFEPDIVTDHRAAIISDWLRLPQSLYDIVIGYVNDYRARNMTFNRISCGWNINMVMHMTMGKEFVYMETFCLGRFATASYQAFWHWMCTRDYTGFANDVAYLDKFLNDMRHILIKKLKAAIPK